MVFKLSSITYDRRRTPRSAAGLLLLGALCLSVASAQEDPNWTKPFPAFKILGNLYWVGTWDLSTYLIVTPQGDILINTGLVSTVPEIRAGIEKLGFKMSDIKILTATHGHFDHVAGMAELKRITGAKLMISETDKELLETGGKADFRFGDTLSARFEPVKVDQTFKDGDTIALDGTVLTAHSHPGHTKGATSFTWDVVENGKTYKVVVANLGSINPGVNVAGMPKYPGIGADYAKTFAAQKAMKVDVFLASHASQFGLHQKYQPGDPYNPDRFVDPQGFQTAVRKLEETYLTQLDKDRK
jgi:metallo-beta-lactamase class B